LINPWLILARRLPHVAVKQTEPDLSFHIISGFVSGAADKAENISATVYKYKVSVFIANPG